ncbi:hypothetical protein ACB092_08G150300 [Castanea dentata]
MGIRSLMFAWWLMAILWWSLEFGWCDWVIWVSLRKRQGIVFKEFFFFFSQLPNMEEMRLFLWLFLLIFSYFLNYQTQSRKELAFFVKFYFKKKEPKKTTAMLLILRRKGEEISENKSLSP